MIDTTTYANAWAHIQQYHRSKGLYWFAHIVDQLNNDYYYSNYHTQIGDYTPLNLRFTQIILRGSIYSGGYSVSPVKVTLSNMRLPQADGTYEALSERSVRWISGSCTIYFGYDGCTTSDLVEVYHGRILNVAYDLVDIEFEVADRAIFELPAIPKNKIDRTNYPYIDEELIGKPIPLVYGRFDTEHADYDLYGYKSVIPGYVIQTDWDNNQMVVEFADHALDRIDEVLIYDDRRNVLGVIEDSGSVISSDLANAQVTINFFTEKARDLLNVTFYHYPNRVEEISTAIISNDSNAIDHDFDTYATFDGSTLDAIMELFLANMGEYTRDELEPFYSHSDGTKTRNIEYADIQLSGYPSGNFSAGDTLVVEIENSTFSESFDNAAVNALSDSDSFNLTLTDDLQICYPYNWDGSTTAITIRESDDASGTTTQDIDLQPDAGHYWTMSEFAAHLEQKLSESSADNTYQVVYMAAQNKFRFTITTSGATYPYFKLIDTARSDDIGVTADSSSWSNTTQVSDTYTILDVPDGNFSLIRLRVTVDTSTGGSGESFNLKGMRVRISYAYRDYILRTKLPGGGRIWQRRQPRPRNYEFIRFTGRGGGKSYGGYIDRDYQMTDTIRNEISGSKIFLVGDGRPDNGAFHESAPDIIKSLLEDVIGIDSGDIDTTSFTAAESATDLDNHLYLDAQTEAFEVIADIARFNRGFVWLKHNGDYAMTSLKSSYSSGDVNFTIYLRDIKDPSRENIRFYRQDLNEIADQVFFHFRYNQALEKYERIEDVAHVGVTGLEIVEKNMYCPYLHLEADATTAWKHFCGVDGGTVGQFGKPHAVIEFTTLNPEFLFAELGDIMQFDSEFDSYINNLGGTLSSDYFMVLGKQFDLSQVKITLFEIDASR